MVYYCFDCNNKFAGHYPIKCYYARHHDDKRGV